MVQTTVRVSDRLEQILREIARRVELSPSAHNAVRRHYKHVSEQLALGRLTMLRPSLFAQGSYRLRTTVKPTRRDEFDLDFVVELFPDGVIQPEALYDLVSQEVEAIDPYNGKVERRDRCVRIYLDGLHSDILPAIPDAQRPFGLLIPDRKGQSFSWRRSDPQGYISWFEQASSPRIGTKILASIEPLPVADAVKSPLQIAVQLFKRNHHVMVPNELMRTPSIVLTTIAGQAAGGALVLGDAMQQIVEAALDYARTPRHVVHPTSPDEVITEKWNDEDVFGAFQRQAEGLAAHWAQVVATQGTGYPALLDLLLKMFGNGDNVVGEAVKSVANDLYDLSKQGRIATAAAGGLTVVRQGRGNPQHTNHGD